MSEHTKILNVKLMENMVLCPETKKGVYEGTYVSLPGCRRYCSKYQDCEATETDRKRK